MPAVQTGTWTATGSLTGARSGAASVLLADGSVLVTGGSDGSASVDAVESFGADGAFSAAAAMTEARADHSAVVLSDGQVLVVGGRNASGAVASAEVLVDGAWLAAGALSDARWGHTATVLADDRVLIAGGENAAGPVGTIEIFDPATGQVSVAGSLVKARNGHAAARLADGRVLIAGGSDLAGALNSTEIVDAATQSITPGPALGSKRSGLSATTLLDGKVLLLGGNNGTSNLASAELFNPTTGAITATASASVARRDHQAFLLPNNNAVLIVGGMADITVNGVSTTEPTASAELFLPWLPAVWPTGPMSAVRLKATGSVLSKETYGAAAAAGEGLLMVAGGEASNGSEAYRFATIRSDQIDYLPGETVYISASGWQPGETVSLGLRELPAEHVTRTFTIQADGNGEIVAAPLFLVEPHHFGVRFFLTATGAASQAHITFTDGNVKVRIAPSGSFALTVHSFTGNGNITCSGNPNQTQNTTISNNNNGDNVGAGNSFSIRLTAAAFSTAGGAFQGWSGSKAFTGTNPICIDVSSGSDLFTATYSLSVATTLTLQVPSPQTVTFGSTGPVVLSATVRRASTGAFLPGGLVQFTIDGVTVGSAPSNTAGAAFMSYNPSTLNAGAHNVVASLAAQTIGGTAYAASTSNTTVLSVSKANQTINFTPLANKTYGDAPFALAATGGSSGNPVTFALGAGSVGCSVSGTTVTIVSATPVDENCIIVASQAGNDNYNDAPDVTRMFMIGRATPIVTATWTGGTYNGNSWPATATVNGVGTPAAVLTTPAPTLTYYSGVTPTGTPLAGAPTNAGTYTVRASFAGDDNYNPATDDETITIAKATPIVTASWTGGTYNGTPWPATATVTGVGNPPEALTTPAATFAYYSGGTATGTPLGGAPTNAGTYTVRASFAGDDNYNTATDDETITIAKADPIVTATWTGGTFSGNAWPATASVTGVGTPAAVLTTPGATFAYYSGATATGTPLGTAPTDAGTYTVRASFAGDDNYNPAHDDETIVIAKAPTSTTVTCTGGPFTYNGDPQTPCSVSVTGAAGLNETPAPTYANNVNAGTATASYTYAESANHLGSTDSETFEIAKAPTTTAVTCTAGPFTYNGAAQTPCSVLVTGAAGLNETPAPSYANNVNAGTATASYTYAESANHLGSTDSETFEIAKAPTTTAVSCTAGPFVYNSAAHTPCSVSVSGAGGLNLAPAPDYANNVNAGTASASYTYAESANHLGSTDDENFTIDKAGSVTTVTCTPGPFVYSGSAHTPCSVSVTGAGGLNETPAPDYANNVNAGTASASYTYAESANHLGSTDDENFAIDKAGSVTTVTCTPGPFVYSGSAHTPCSVSVTGAGGLNETPATDYANNMNAGTATASYTFGGDANHSGSNDSETFTIDRVGSETAVTCAAGPFVYNGLAHEPCSVSVTGAGGLSETPAPIYANNVNAGTATASYTYAGDANHEGSDDSETFVIAKAASSTVVTCTAGPFTYNAAAQTPCSVAVTGAGGLNETPAPTYANNVDAGTATASYTYAGDSNHDGSSNSKNFTIDKATSTTALTFEAGPYVYRATLFTATAQVTGVGGLNQAVTPVVYSGDCTNVTIANGCTATATFGGDLNHLGSNDSKSVTITKRTLTITPAGGKIKTLGSVFTAFTGSVVGLLGSDAGNATYSSTGAPAAAPVGRYNITSSFTFTNGSVTNYDVQAGTAVEGLWVQYLWDGFLQPINDTAHDAHTTAPYSSFKTGQTIPAKFELKNSSGQVVVQTGSPIFQRSGNLGACGTAALDTVDITVAPDSDGLYKQTGTQYLYGWNTKGLTQGLYQIYARLADGTARAVFICLTR